LGIWEFENLKIWGFGNLEIWGFENLEIWKLTITSYEYERWVVFLRFIISAIYMFLKIIKINDDPKRQKGRKCVKISEKSGGMYCA
jgi:hypothetical protein